MKPCLVNRPQSPLTSSTVNTTQPPPPPPPPSSDPCIQSTSSLTSPSSSSQSSIPAPLRGDDQRHSILKRDRYSYQISRISDGIDNVVISSQKEDVLATNVHLSYENADDQETTTLMVNDTRFVVHPALFQAYPHTMLGRMFSSSWRKTIKEGEVEIAKDISSETFKVILDYYKTGLLKCPMNVSIAELKETCDYFLIPFSVDNVKCHDLSGLLHELSNDGARNQFENFLVNDILSILVKCATKGNLFGGKFRADLYHWDMQFPPQADEEYAGAIKSSQMHKFFKYVENRNIAKQVLKDRGFKKIKLGIEGFPTDLDKIKVRGPGKAEVIYNYIQRPFLKMSWEKEEAKSRHVDFQCVRSKSLVSETQNTEITQGNICPF
ncbi:hypothetical protein ACOME3_008717 [Neoechinorhynchus agilis]